MLLMNRVNHHSNHAASVNINMQRHIIGLKLMLTLVLWKQREYGTFRVKDEKNKQLMYEHTLCPCCRSCLRTCGPTGFPPHHQVLTVSFLLADPSGSQRPGLVAPGARPSGSVLRVCQLLYPGTNPLQSGLPWQKAEWDFHAWPEGLHLRGGAVPTGQAVLLRQEKQPRCLCVWDPPSPFNKHTTRAQVTAHFMFITIK